MSQCLTGPLMTTFAVEVNGCTIYRPYFLTLKNEEAQECGLMNCGCSSRLPFVMMELLRIFFFFLSRSLFFYLVLKKITILLGPAHYCLAGVTIRK